MNEDPRLQSLVERVDTLTGLVTDLTKALAAQHPPPPLQRVPPTSSPEIDPWQAVNAGIPTTSEESHRGSRRSSLLANLEPVLTPLRANPKATTTQALPDDKAAIQMVATEIKIKEEDKLTVVSIRAVRRLQRLYRAHRNEFAYSKHTLADFIKYPILKEIRANEFALGTDLSKALVAVEDLKQVGDVAMLNALARFHRTQYITNKGTVATRLYIEVEQIKWPPEYRDVKTNTWAINPEGFHLAMYSKLLEWTTAMREAVDFIYHCATQEELRHLLPAVSYGTRYDPELIQMATRGLGDLAESITTLVGQKRLELVKDIAEWEDLLNGLFTGYANQSRALAQQRAQATKAQLVDDLWNKSQQTEKRIQPFIMPRARVPSQYNNDYRRGAVVHSFEDESSQQEEGAMLALTESSIKDDEDSEYYSASDFYFGAENEEELFALTSGLQPKDSSGLPCFGDYEGVCKLGQACPFVKSHGNKELMRERTRRLIMQVLKSKYGGREVIGEIISEHQLKQNTQPKQIYQVSQDYRQTKPQWNQGLVRGEIERYPQSREPYSGRELAPRPQGNTQPTRTGNMVGMRSGGDHGRGGGRLVTYGGRGNMGRAQYTNHLLQDDESDPHDQVEEVMEGDEEESS
jgi:hypothetical protein